MWLGAGNPWFATFLISLLPVIELRGAIPFGVDGNLWGDTALGYWQAFGVALLGNVLVAAVILAILVPAFNWLRRFKFFRKFVEFFEERFQNKANKTQVKKLLFIFVFCAVPLPLTGVWTAAGIAAFMKLGYLKSLIAISLGAAVSGVLMVGITVLFGAAALSIFYFFCFAAIAVLAVIFTTAILKKTKEKSINND